MLRTMMQIFILRLMVHSGISAAMSPGPQLVGPGVSWNLWGGEHFSKDSVCSWRSPGVTELLPALGLIHWILKELMDSFIEFIEFIYCFIFFEFNKCGPGEVNDTVVIEPATLGIWTKDAIHGHPIGNPRGMNWDHWPPAINPWLVYFGSDKLVVSTSHAPVAGTLLRFS